MPREYTSNIRLLRKNFYVAIVSVLFISFLLASWLNSEYYYSPNERRILSVEAIKEFAPYLLLSITTILILRCFQGRFSQNKVPIAFYLFLSISYFTIIIQLIAFSNQLPILTRYVGVEQDHCLSYVAASRPSDAPHRQFLLYFRARRFLKDAILLVPSEHAPDSRLAYLCRANIRNASYGPEITIQEARKLISRNHIALPGKDCTYVLVPDGETDVAYYHMRKIGEIFFILPLSSPDLLESPTL